MFHDTKVIPTKKREHKSNHIDWESRKCNANVEKMCGYIGVISSLQQKFEHSSISLNLPLKIHA